MTESGATPDGGCAELEDLPSVPGLPMSAITGLTSARDQERLRAREEALQAREATWVRNVPAEQCFSTRFGGKEAAVILETEITGD